MGHRCVPAVHDSTLPRRAGEGFVVVEVIGDCGEVGDVGDFGEFGEDGEVEKGFDGNGGGEGWEGGKEGFWRLRDEVRVWWKAMAGVGGEGGGDELDR